MENTGTPIGSYAPDFELPGTDGSVHHLSHYLEKFKAIGVIVMCNHCPYVRMYLDRLKQLQELIQPQGATLVGINANDDSHYPDDSFEKMGLFVTEHQLNFPYLRDVTQDVVRSFGAELTPEAFLIDQAGILRYRGLIDDNPQAPEAVETAHLAEAIAQLLDGQVIVTPSTKAVGCSVKWRT
ncbi:MAG TPA: thioredoxin family protein [Chroococcidiopsis sp.]